jgi:hypothetical protein
LKGRQRRLIAILTQYAKIAKKHRKVAIQVSTLMKQQDSVKTDRVLKRVKTKRTLPTAGTTLKTATKGQCVLKTSISIRKQNAVRISAKPVVRTQETFHNAESVHRKVRYWNMIVISSPHA